MTRDRRGFTLVEVIIAVLLGSMIIMALASIFGTAFRSQSAEFSREINVDSVLASYRSIVGSVENATRVVLPAIGGQSNVLRGCTNFSVSANQRIVAANPIRWFNFCVDATGNMWYAWTDTQLNCAVGAPPSCGAAGAYAGGQVMQVGRRVFLPPGLAGQDRRGTNCIGGNQLFCRRANARNVIQLHYQVDIGTAASVISSDVTMATSLNDPNI